MLSKRWHSLFSITTATFFIILLIQIFPVIASSGLSFPNLNDSYLASKFAIANNSIVTTKDVTTKENPSSLLYQLNLSDSQKEQIKQIHHQYKQQIQKKRDNLTVLQQQLSDLMVGTESAELIRAKNRQVVNLRAEIGELRFESMLATREILTPQQRQKFREIIKSQLTQ